MKSFMAILPLAGLALAQGECGARKTVTKTEVNRVTITVQPSPVASAEADDDWTITSTIKTTTTITEWPSSSPAATRAHTHKPHFSHHPYGNGTFNATSTRVPTHTPQAPTTLETFVFASSSPAAVASSSASSSQSAVTLYVSPSPVAAPSEAAIPTSESAAAVASAAPSTSPAKSSSSSDVTGTATFYGGNIDGGACSFTGYTIPSGLFGTAFGGNWDASQCGACVAVKGPNGNSITAMVVDQCPECDVTHLDLFQNAFGELADISKGVIDISYSIVPCDITTPITLKNKEGTSAYFFSMQVENANVAVSKLEVSTDGGATWQATTRQSYNFFEKSDKSGFGSDTVDVKVTSVDGSSITVNDVSVSAGSTKAASGNFS